MSDADWMLRTQPKGTQVVCWNGHPVCKVIEDLAPGDIPWAQKLGNWTQREPHVGETAPINCEVCGAPWFPFTSRSFVAAKA